MGRQSQSGNHRQKMARSCKTVQQSNPGGRMEMTAVAALATDMKVHVPMT